MTAAGAVVTPTAVKEVMVLCPYAEKQTVTRTRLLRKRKR